jgi:predicted XRE-type DNA-binding protein
MTNHKAQENLASEITVGSGNVFADLGLPNPEEMLIKAQLAKQIYLCITERQLTQVEAATILGIDQPKVSNLINLNVEISIKTKPRSQPNARVVVVN